MAHTIYPQAPGYEPQSYGSQTNIAPDFEDHPTYFVAVIDNFTNDRFYFHNN